MRKKFLHVFTALVCAAVCVMGFVACGGNDDDETLYYTLNDDGKSYCVSGLWKEDTENVNIPATYKGKPVTAIGDRAFREKSIKKINISENIKTIGSSAFAYCVSLNTITVSDKNPVFHSVDNCLIETESKTLVLGCRSSVIPDDGSVTTIGAAFSGSQLLGEITIPNSVTTIGRFAFFDCISLFTVNIGRGVVTIEGDAFSKCSSITRLTIPASVAEIGVAAFHECDRLKEVTFINPYGWKAYENGELADNIRQPEFDDPSTAAENLLSYAAYTLIRT